MSKYICSNYATYGIVVRIDQELDPADFLDCESLDELEDEVQASCWGGEETDIETFDVGDYDHGYSDSLPKEFINEWKQLKGYV